MSDEGHLAVRRLRVLDTFARYVIDAKAMDTQTGQVCRVLVSN